MWCLTFGGLRILWQSLSTRLRRTLPRKGGCARSEIARKRLRTSFWASRPASQCDGGRPSGSHTPARKGAKKLRELRRTWRRILLGALGLQRSWLGRHLVTEKGTLPLLSITMVMGPTTWRLLPETGHQTSLSNTRMPPMALWIKLLFQGWAATPHVWTRLLSVLSSQQLATRELQEIWSKLRTRLHLHDCWSARLGIIFSPAACSTSLLGWRCRSRAQAWRTFRFTCPVKVLTCCGRERGSGRTRFRHRTCGRCFPAASGPARASPCFSSATKQRWPASSSCAGRTSSPRTSRARGCPLAPPWSSRLAGPRPPRGTRALAASSAASGPPGETSSPLRGRAPMGRRRSPVMPTSMCPWRLWHPSFGPQHSHWRTRRRWAWH
mmetsp:Transcript_63012/g.174658  ORF Transcript_63012/g.174658 Transcript_63012/m.174658 type:complete len:381 (-) Transcript_63012:168-1310(-)